MFHKQNSLKYKLKHAEKNKLEVFFPFERKPFTFYCSFCISCEKIVVHDRIPHPTMNAFKFSSKMLFIVSFKKLIMNSTHMD